MHVGHLRTTVVGDALARTLEHLGHHVVRQNHIGDWGTPFGMLIEHLLDVGEDTAEARAARDRPQRLLPGGARRSSTATTAFADARPARARGRRCRPATRTPCALWQELVDLSKRYFNTDLLRRSASRSPTTTSPASRRTTPCSAAICDELEARRHRDDVSEGALCVFLDGFTGREGKPVPLIIRKSDGGYGYATTDLATIRYRVRDLHADRVLYVIGAPQALHLNMVFDTARKAGWLPDDVEAGARPDRQRAGRGPQDPARPASGRPAAAHGRCSTRPSTTARARHRRGPSRPRRGGARDDRAARSASAR